MKKIFLNKLGLLFSAREKVLNSFKSRLFPIKNFDKISTHEPATKQEVAKEPEPEVATKATKAKNRWKISPLKLREYFWNKTKNEERNINEQIFKKFFCQTPSHLAKDLYDSDEAKNDDIVKHIKNELIELKNYINIKEITENEDLKNVVSIVKKSSTSKNNKIIKYVLWT